MGGKARRRREKNYKAAHGGNTRLPPPPDPSKVDALPAKLRTIMSFTSPAPPSSEIDKFPKSNGEKKRKRGGGADADDKKARQKDDLVGGAKEKDVDDDGHLLSHQNVVGEGEEDGDNSDDGVAQEDRIGKRKKKRKRNKGEDLRFISELANSNSKSKEKRRQRKKKYLEAKKLKKSKTEEDIDFPGREQIKFGDVVQAPPKLIDLSKAQKNIQDASKERLRLQAIENYRNRKGWTSRLGLKLPLVDAAPAF